MTKAYKNMSPMDAINQAARRYPGSVEALAQRMGKSCRVMRNKLDPDVATHHLAYEEAIEIVELLDGVIPAAADFALNALAWRLNRHMQRHAGADADAGSLSELLLAFLDASTSVASSIQELTPDAVHGAARDRANDAVSFAISNAINSLYALKDGFESSVEASAS